MAEKRVAKGVLEARAQAAFLLHNSQGVQAEQIKSVYTTTIQEKQYVVLESRTARLAVYRVRKYDGVLRILRRWPKGLQDFDPRKRRESTQTVFDPEDKTVEEWIALGLSKAEPTEEPSADLPPWRNPDESGPMYISPTQGA